MIKKMLGVAVLGAALLGGGAGVSHLMGSPLAHASTAMPELTLNAVGDQATDTDASAPCTGQGTANEAGNCADSQNQSGPADNTGAAETPDTGEVTTGPDGDTTQSRQ